MPVLTPVPTDPLFAVGALVASRVPEGFDDRPYELFDVEPMTPIIGCEVAGVQLGGDLDDEVMADLRRALLEWKVLVFRDQDITRDDQRAFASRWGELEQHPFFKHFLPSQSDADVATFAKDAKSQGVENNWHHDITWHTTPSFGAVLRAVEVPQVGGDTLWADMAAAYDVLPAGVQHRIDPLVAEHDWLQAFGPYIASDVVEKLRVEYPPVEHPVVRVHPETGRKSLFVNIAFTQRILGMATNESDELLRMLYRHVQRPELQCRVRWRPNTVVFWDNRASQHYAASDYHPNRRVMDRISIVGDRPYGPTAVA